MSFAAITKVANIKTGDDKSKSVLLWLAFHLNDETGLCCPSISLLRKETEVGSDNTIRAALSRLREKGLVSWTREIEDGCVKRTLYTLNLDASKGEPASAIEPTSAIEVPQPLKGGTSTIEGGYFNGCAGVPQPLKENKEIEQGKEQGREQGSFSPAFACDAPADGVAHKTGVTPSPDDWASLLAEPAPMEDDYPADLFSDVDPATAKVPAPKPRTNARTSSSSTSSRAKPKRLCPFDLDAVIPDDWRDAFAADYPTLDLAAEFRKFVGWHVAKGNTYADWKAAFRNWLGNAVKFQARDTARGARPTGGNFRRAMQKEDMVYTDDF